MLYHVIGNIPGVKYLIKVYSVKRILWKWNEIHTIIFQVYGKLATYDGYERFEWSHSYSKVYYPKGKYDSRGVFMYFENYNVEVRDRVKCVSASEGKYMYLYFLQLVNGSSVHIFWHFQWIKMKVLIL